MSFEIGQTVGDYEIIGVLGAGGMGKVYKVRNVISDRVEAMKVLLPNLESDPELADRFIREIKVQASLDHPNIAGLHTALRGRNQLLMIMEFVEGRSLESMVKEGPVPLKDGVGYVCQVLSALAYAHARGVVHRDIKPANMMLTPGGVIKLMDFGIARMAEADRKLTQTGRTVGSLFYMSPEQINGAAVDARADLYSLGISLYEIVTGRRPYQGDSDFSIMAAHLSGLPVPPIEIDPSLPAALNEIILTSIAKHADERFQSADAFRNALLNVLRDLGEGLPARAPVAPPPVAQRPQPVAPQAYAPPSMGAPAPPPRPSSRRGLYMALGSLATIAVIVLAATQLPRWTRTKAVESPAAPAAVTLPPAAEPVPGTPAAGQQTAAEDVVPREATGTQRSVTPADARLRQPGDRPRAAQPPALGQAPAAGTVAPQQQAPVTTPPPQRASGPDPAKAAALKEARHRMMLMAARIGGIKPSLDNLRRGQGRMGLSLRGDMATAWQRLEYQMDEADASIKAGDPEAARTHLDAAEGDLEKLEAFLGR